MVNLDKRGVEDLVYEYAAWAEVRARFPNAEREDASDLIHDSRFSVRLPDVTLREWYTFLLDSGWYNVSFAFQIAMYEPKESEFGVFIREWIAAHPKAHGEAGDRVSDTAAKPRSRLDEVVRRAQEARQRGEFAPDPSKRRKRPRPQVLPEDRNDEAAYAYVHLPGKGRDL